MDEDLDFSEVTFVGRSFQTEAQFAGSDCLACEEPIHIGELITKDRVLRPHAQVLEGWVHVTCPEPKEEPRHARCASCGLEHAGEC